MTFEIFVFLVVVAQELDDLDPDRVGQEPGGVGDGGGPAGVEVAGEPGRATWA